MAESDSAHRRSAVICVDDIGPHTDLDGHPGCAAYRMLAPPDDFSRWLHVTYDAFEPGGAISPHYHEGLDADHAYYVIEGEVRAQIGDEHFDVGPRSLMIFPCEVVHGFSVVSPDGAKILRLGAAPDGRTSGGSVFVSHAGKEAS